MHHWIMVTALMLGIFAFTIAPHVDYVTAQTTNSPEQLPIVTSKIPPLHVDINQTSNTINLNNYFIDADGDELTFTASVTSYGAPGSVTTDIQAGAFTVTGANVGTARLIITAQDPDGNKASVEVYATAGFRQAVSETSEGSLLPDAQIDAFLDAQIDAFLDAQIDAFFDDMYVRILWVEHDNSPMANIDASTASLLLGTTISAKEVEEFYRLQNAAEAATHLVLSMPDGCEGDGASIVIPNSQLDTGNTSTQMEYGGTIQDKMRYLHDQVGNEAAVGHGETLEMPTTLKADGKIIAHVETVTQLKTIHKILNFDHGMLAQYLEQNPFVIRIHDSPNTDIDQTTPISEGLDLPSELDAAEHYSEQIIPLEIPDSSTLDDLERSYASPDYAAPAILGIKSVTEMSIYSLDEIPDGAILVDPGYDITKTRLMITDKCL